MDVQDVQTVALVCPICGKLHDKPLTVDSDGEFEGEFEGAQIAAYDCDAVCWDESALAPGAVIEADVSSPFCCTVGDSFWAESGSQNYVHARLLEILHMDESSARIITEIIEMRTLDDFANTLPVSDEKKSALRRRYYYSPPEGDTIAPDFEMRNENIMCFSNTWGGGDIYTLDCIYCDPDGIDHLIMRDYKDFEGTTIFIGDKVLGFKEDRFFQWEGDLLIDWLNQGILACRQDVREVIVPEGIVDLGVNAFFHCSELERIVIPESVVYSGISGLYNCKKLKEFVVLGNSRLKNDINVPKETKIIRMP